MSDQDNTVVIQVGEPPAPRSDEQVMQEFLEVCSRLCLINTGMKSILTEYAEDAQEWVRQNAVWDRIIYAQKILPEMPGYVNRILEENKCLRAGVKNLSDNVANMDRILRNTEGELATTRSKVARLESQVDILISLAADIQRDK